MAEFPLRIIILLVSLESFLLAFQSRLIEDYSENSEEKKKTESFFFDILSWVASLATVIFMNVIRISRRRRLIICTSILAACFLFSLILVAFNHRFFFVLLIISFALQSMSKTGMLTSILSIITIEKGEVGYYFALQFIAFQVGYFIGYLAFLIIEIEAKKFYIYFMVILLFMLVSIYLYRNLPEIHDEIYYSNYKIWLAIIKVKFIKLNFSAFIISLGVAYYNFYILFQSLKSQPIGVALLTFMLSIFSYPISLWIVYKYFRPIKPKPYIVFGLILLSIAIIISIILYVDIGDYFKLFTLFSPVLCECGLVFVIVSVIPEMIETVASELNNEEFGLISDRICSLVYIAFYKGKIGILIVNVIIRLLFGDFVCNVLCGIFVLLFAVIYEFKVKGVKEYFKESSRVNDDLSLNDLSRVKNFNRF